MNTKFYNDLLNALREYNGSMENYGNKIVKYPPKDATYPHTQFSEIRNTPISTYNGCFERVTSVGYLARIKAKTKGNIDKETIARHCAKIVDDFCVRVGLMQGSYNIHDDVLDNSIVEIILTYSGNLSENRYKLI